MEQINYEPLMPAQPRTDAARLAREAGRFDRSYLIYREGRDFNPLEERWERKARVVCSSCGGTFMERKLDAEGCSHAYPPAPFGWWNEAERRYVISSQETVCPLCGKKAQTVHGSRMTRRGLYGGELVDDAWVTELIRLPAAGRRDRLALTEWLVRRCIGRDGAARYEVWPYSAWVVEEKKVVRLIGWQKPPSGAIHLFGELKQRKQFLDQYGAMDVLAPWDPSLLEGTTAEHCKLDLYLAAGGRHLAGYLALWRKRPAVENLLVQGCGAMVAEWIREEEERYNYRGGILKLPEVNWRESRPARMLGVDKEEFRRLRRERWTPADLQRYRLARDSGVPARGPEDMETLRRFDRGALEGILAGNGRADFWRILRYLRKQDQGWDILRDYWEMARRQGRDLTDSLVRWPRDLRLAHDRAAGEEKHREEEALREKFRRRAEALEPFSFAQGGLLIRPCRDQRELMEEGKGLHHCVARYAEDHAGGAAAIFFIRRADRPEEPFFTLELDEKALEVRQNRGLRNCDRTEEVRAFESAWLEWLRRKGARKIA